MKSKQAEYHDALKKIIELVETGISDSNYHDSKNETPIWVLGAGKASVQIAKNIIKENSYSVIDGIIISTFDENEIPGVQIFKGSHPYPDQNSVAASYELLELAHKIPPEETVIFCLSGGASSLLSIPPKGIEIEELASTHKLLLESGVPINEMNIVRKHLCMLKGGQLAQALHHVNLITLIASDVPRDDLETIGSAPTICDSSTFKDAFQVLKRYQLWNKVPHSIRRCV